MTGKFNRLILPLIFLPVLSQSIGENYDKPLISLLIDELVNIDAPCVGLHPTAWASGFVAEDATPRFAGGVLGSAPPVTSPAFKALVKLGSRALPTLIAHLADVRPTKLKVGERFFMFRHFSNEYDPKKRDSKRNTYPEWKEQGFSGEYTVKVGDVCYAIIGQIVNRNLCAIRYQPSAGLVVNSPIEMPEIALQVKNDWENITADDLKNSLVSDLEQADDFELGLPAIQRLRFYFPKEYAKLKTGLLKDKILGYEQEERKEK